MNMSLEVKKECVRKVKVFGRRERDLSNWSQILYLAGHLISCLVRTAVFKQRRAAAGELRVTTEMHASIIG